MLIYALFVIGFIILIKGADLLVEGSSNLAAKMGISEIIIGLTIVSIGTSMPELIVNIIASFNGSSEMAIGNVFGSNIANLLLILGFTSLMKPLPVQRNTIISEIPYSIAAILLIGFLANAKVWTFVDESTNGLSRFDGYLIMTFFAIFFAYIFMMAREDINAVTEEVEIDDKSPVAKDIGLVVVGMILLFFGGKWVVEGAVHIALQIGMSETFISLTLVALGTSLPELVTSIKSASKGSTDLAVGNVVGSNIFNALWILGISSSIRDIPFDKVANFDLLIVVLATMLVIVLMLVSRKTEIKKWHGFVLLAAYVAYNIYIYIRG
jgi:cation:H+ antiporter